MPITPPAQPSRPDHGGSHGPPVSAGEKRSGGTRVRSKSALLAAIRQRRRAALVVNARSRRGVRLYQAAASQLHAAGFDLLGSFPVSQPGQLQASLDAALDLSPDLLSSAAATAPSAWRPGTWPTATSPWASCRWVPPTTSPAPSRSR